MNRKPIPQWWMSLAREFATQSTCPRASVGVMVANRRDFVSAGYNGAPSGEPHCTDIGCQMESGHCVRARHAERNALEFAGKYRTRGATLYTTHFPCANCARLVVEYGIIRVVYDKDYRIDADVVCYFQHHGVEILQLEEAVDESQA